MAIVGVLFATQASATICAQEHLELERVQGIVLDEEGEALLSGVRLTLSRQGAPFERIETSDHEGFFSFATVPAGDYVVRVELEGFSTHQATLRVTKGSHLGQVLVVRLIESFEGCGQVTITSARKARRVQKEILGRKWGRLTQRTRSGLRFVSGESDPTAPAERTAAGSHWY